MSHESCHDKEEDSAPRVGMIDAPGNQRTDSTRQDHKKPSKYSSWRGPSTWNVVFNGILAITTIFLGLIAYWQYNSSNLDQRAWVGPTSFIHPGEGCTYFKEGSQPSFGVVVTNTGKTPARKVEAMIQRQTIKRGVPFNATYNDTGGPSSAIILFPGRTFNLTTKPESLPLTAEQVEIITTGEFTLYVYGAITYEDVFAIKHQTTFCGYLKPDLTSFNACNT